MEGSNQVIEGSIKNNTFTDVQINNAPEVNYFHNGIMMFYVLTTILFNLCMLNVFIGLLSTVYEEKKSKALAHFEAFRLVNTERYLALNLCWKYYLRGWR